MSFARATIWYIADSLRTKRSHGFCHLKQNSAKPQTSWIGMLGCRMEQVFVKGSDVQRHRQQIEIEDGGIRTDESLRDHGDKVGLGNHMPCLEVVRNSKRDVSPMALFVKPSIDRIFGEFPSNDRNVLHFEKLPLTRNLARNRIAASQRARIAIRKQSLLITAVERIRDASDGEIHSTGKLEWV